MFVRTKRLELSIVMFWEDLAQLVCGVRMNRYPYIIQKIDGFFSESKLMKQSVKAYLILYASVMCIRRMNWHMHSTSKTGVFFFLELMYKKWFSCLLNGISWTLYLKRSVKEFQPSLLIKLYWKIVNEIIKNQRFYNVKMTIKRIDLF